MASNQADISRFGERSFAELVDQEHETIGIPSRSRETVLKAGLAALLILAMAFIALPVVALFLKSPLDTTLRSLHDPMVLDALRLSLTTSTLTTLIVVIIGTPIAYVNARFNYFGKELVDSLIDLPVIMPPAVAGIALLMAFGRMGIVGQYINAFGISIAFTTLAVIIAQVFVSSPFYIRQAKTSFEDVDLAFENAARTLGSSRVYTFILIYTAHCHERPDLRGSHGLRPFTGRVWSHYDVRRQLSRPDANHASGHLLSHAGRSGRLTVHCHNTGGHLLCGHSPGEDPDPAGVQEC